MLGALLFLLISAVHAGPAMQELMAAAETSHHAAAASDPLKSQALAAQMPDGTQRHVLTTMRAETTPVEPQVEPKKEIGSEIRPIEPSLPEEPKKKTKLDAFATLGIGALWIGIGMFAKANPWAAVAWGIISLVQAISIGVSKESTWKEKWPAVTVLGLSGALAIAAPALGAVGFIAIGAVVGLFGLYKLISSFI